MESKQSKIVYAPWVPMTTASYINNVQVWDYRWWKNILCKINWFFHFRLRKQFRNYKRKKINSSFYGTFKKI